MLFFYVILAYLYIFSMSFVVTFVHCIIIDQAKGTNVIVH